MLSDLFLRKVLQFCDGFAKHGPAIGVGGLLCDGDEVLDEGAFFDFLQEELPHGFVGMELIGDDFQAIVDV